MQNLLLRRINSQNLSGYIQINLSPLLNPYIEFMLKAFTKNKLVTYLLSLYTLLEFFLNRPQTEEGGYW